MMRWVRLVLVLSLVGVLPGFAGTLHRDPGGFEGIKWLTPISETIQLHLVHDKSEFRTYIKTGPLPEIAGVAPDNIRYQFYKDRLANVQIRYRGHENYEMLKGWVRALGHAAIPHARWGSHIMLAGPETIISLQYDRTDGRGVLSFASRAIEAELVSQGLGGGD